MRFQARARQALGLLFLATAPAAAQAPMASVSTQAPDDPLPMDTAVTVGKLPNGLQYYLRYNKEPAKRAELRLVVKAGSLQEDDDQRGLAHFLEHMAFNGTKHFEKQKLVNYIESIGMRFGGDLNAATTFGSTTYMLTVPTDNPTALEQAMLIMEDWAQAISLDKNAIEAERGVVLSEHRLHLGLGTRVRLHTDSALLGDSRYLNRSPIGLPQIIQTATKNDIQRFYKDWYRPDLMAVVVVGDIDKAATEAMIRSHFSKFSGPGKKRELTEFPIPANAAPAVSIVSDKEATGWSVELLQKYRPSPVNSTARTKESLAEGIFENVVNQRLREIGLKPDAPFLSAGTDFGAFYGGWKIHKLSVAARESQLERGLEAVLTEVERVAQHGITAEELSRAKKQISANFDQQMITRSKIPSASYASAYWSHFMTGATPAAIDVAVARARRQLAEVSNDDIVALAKRWHSRENIAIVGIVPQKEGAHVATAGSLLAVLDEVGAATLAEQREVTSGTQRPLMTKLPVSGTVVKENRIVDAGITEWTLSNGAKVLLKPTTFSPDQILLSGYAWGGTSVLPNEELQNAALARVLPATSGLADFTSTQLRNAMVGKIVTAGMQIGSYAQSVGGNSTQRDFESLLQLVYLHFTAPRVDSQAVRAWRERVRTAIENRGNSPEAHFSDTLSLALTQANPRSMPMRVGQVDSISTDRALAIYKKMFAGAEDFTFVIVGTFNPDSIKPLVARYLGGIPGRDSTEGWKDTGVRMPAGVVEKEFRVGLEPRSRTAIVFNGPFVDGVNDQMALGAMAQVLTMRLRDRLREELGGTYSISASPAIQSIPERMYTVTIGFDAAPDRADELRAAVFEEVQRLRTSGPTKEELAKVREESMRQLQLARESNRWWLSLIMQYVQTDRSLDELADYGKALETMTISQVQGMAKRYLSMDRYVRVTQLPGQ